MSVPQLYTDLKSAGMFYADNYSSPMANDDAPRIQQALNDAEGTGGTVYLSGDGQNLLSPIVVPPNVTLQGTFKSSPSHTVQYDGFWGAGHDVPRVNSGGTALYINSGKGDVDAQPAITLKSNSSIKGCFAFYKEQNVQSATPIPYPWTILVDHSNNSCIENFELLNSYNGIIAKQSHRGIFRNINGQPLHIGIRLEGGGDINRLENIHWGAMYTYGTSLYNYIQNNATGFQIGREDLLNGSSCFAFGYGTGWEFFQSSAEFWQNGFEPGSNNGPRGPWAIFNNCSADVCNRNIVVSAGQKQTITFVNGTFTNVYGLPPIQVTGGFSGRFKMIAPWIIAAPGTGGAGGIFANINGSGMVTINDGTFSARYDENNAAWGGTSASTGIVTAGTGTVKLSDNEFCTDQPQINLAASLAHAHVTNNAVNGTVRITNNMSSNFLVAGNG